MEVATILTLTGIIISVIFGFLSIELFRQKKNPGKLTLVKQSAFGLFSNITKTFADIAILYKMTSNPRKYYLFKGFFHK